MKLKSIFSALLILLVLDVSAQEKKQAPIPLEVVLGNNRCGIQTILNRQIPRIKNFSFFSVTYVDNDYQNNVDHIEFSNVSQLIYSLYKGFGVSTGLNTNKVSGFSPSLGARYTYASPKILVVISPDYIFSESKNVALFSLVQYQPKLSEKINLYSRFQGLYNHNLKIDDHERSYVQFRLGVGIKEYSFGVASNIDYFGPNKALVDNFGLFFKIDL